MPFVESYDLIIEPYRKGFATTQRPKPANMHDVDHFEKGKYDLAILHVDQQCIYDPARGDKISKGRLYSEINAVIKETDPDLPIIVINHHTPYHDKYENHEVVDKVKKLIGDNFMIVNSHKAKEQWGWGHVITHGLKASDWWDLPKEPRAAIVLSPAGMEKAYRRTFPRAVCRILDERGIKVEWVGITKKFSSWDQYRDFLGRTLVFFMPTWQSPMPRARTEAMLSGCCIVSTPYHDASTFINSGDLEYTKDGNKMKASGITMDKDTNGFLTDKAEIKDPRIMDNPEYTADLIEYLIREAPNTAIEVGQRGKKTAQDIFSKKKFDDQWAKLLKDMKIL